MSLPRLGASGSLSTSDQDALTYLKNRWENVQERFLISKIPTLNRFKHVPFGPYGIGGAAGMTTNDVLTDGGASTSTNNTTYQSHGGAILTALKTNKWGVTWECKILGPTNGREARIGLTNDFSGTRTVWFGTKFATDTTHYVFHTVDGDVVTSMLADLGPHNMSLTGDSTTITLWGDGSSIATAAASSLTDEKVYDFIANSTGSDAWASQMLVGYVGPVTP